MSAKAAAAEQLMRRDTERRGDEARGMLAAATDSLARSNPRAAAQTLYRLADEASDSTQTDAGFDALAAIHEPPGLAPVLFALVAGFFLGVAMFGGAP